MSSTLSKRRAIVLLSQEDIHRLISLPDNVYMVGLHTDYMRMSIGIQVIGDNLEEIADGTEAPVLQGKMNILIWEQTPIDENGLVPTDESDQ